MWESFWDLSTMRVNGMSIGNIPLDKMVWYAESQLGLDDDEADAFVWIMRRTDNHFVNKQAAKAAKSDK